MTAGFDEDDKKIRPSARINPYSKPAREKGGGKGKKHHGNGKPEKIIDHFDELTRMAEKAHEILIKQNNPLRFCIYKENGEIMIDLVSLGPDGNVLEIRKKNITNDSFLKWVQTILQGNGLIFEKTI